MEAGDIWTEALKAHGHGFCDADDMLKQMNTELKPIKEQHKTHKEKMTALMTAKNKHSARFGNSRVQLQKRVSKSKAPSKDTIRDRCHNWDGERGEELYKMLMASEEGTGEVKYTVRRKLISAAEEEDDKLAKSLEADLDDEEEEEDD